MQNALCSEGREYGIIAQTETDGGARPNLSISALRGRTLRRRAQRDATGRKGDWTMLEPLASKNQERQCTCLDRIIRRELPSGYHFGTHLHHSLEMVACISGQVVVTIHGVEHIVSPGEYLLVFPNIPHSTDVPGGEPAVFLQGHCHADSLTNAVLPQQRTSLVRDLSISRRRAIQAQMNTRLWACLQGLQVELEGEGRHNEDMIRLKLAELSILLSRDLEEADGGHLQENAHLTRAIDYIDQHYMEKLLVQDVAEAAGVSARYLTKLFLEHFHMGVSVYITHVRISRAITYKQTDPDCSLSDLAQEVGFSNQQHFSKVFKETMGIPPKKYFSITVTPAGIHPAG